MTIYFRKSDGAETVCGALDPEFLVPVTPVKPIKPTYPTRPYYPVYNPIGGFFSVIGNFFGGFFR